MATYEDLNEIVVNKDKREPVVVKLTVDNKGRGALNIRHWYFNANGELCPTAKGVVVPIEDKDALIAAIQEV